MAKATVQAALGPVALKRITSNSTPEEKHYAELIMMVCILSIVVTAPIGAILISITGPRLLTKTKPLPPNDGKLRRTKNTAFQPSLMIFFDFSQAGAEVIVRHSTTSVLSTNKRSVKIPKCRRI